MADDDNRCVRLNAAKLFQMPDDASLQGPHALPAGRATCPAPRIPPVPAGIAFEIGKGKRGPLAIIELVNRRDNLDGKAELPSEDRGGLLGAPWGARLDCRGRSVDQLGAASHLPAAVIVELHAR